jgi:hypothetical protein
MLVLTLAGSIIQPSSRLFGAPSLANAVAVAVTFSRSIHCVSLSPPWLLSLSTSILTWLFISLLTANEEKPDPMV